MCGIFGCVGDISLQKMEQCINRISHRGPDAKAIKQLEGIGLAHARLSIIDTTLNANQPMRTPDERYWIVYNGEVYNYIEIRKELEKKGYKFYTKCDTEVLLYAYMEWRENFQYKCNGMWALAVWDTIEKKLFLSRDRYGVKPLFYYMQDGNFYFASEMKAFFPIMERREANYSIFDNKNFFSYEATEECVIHGIKRFPAGSWGEYQRGKLTIKKWWETLEHLEDVPANYSEQVDYFRALFLDACKIRMRSDVPIGTALSGGIDSSTVVGAMHFISEKNDRTTNRDWQHAFVASMPNTRYDETEDADLAARYVGLKINKVVTSPNIGEKELMRYIYMCEDPYITSPVVFLQTYGAIRDNGVKVTLDGHGADEMFGGYSFDLPYAVYECENDIMLKNLYEAFSISNVGKPVTLEEFRKRARYVDYGEVIDSSCLEVWEKLDQFNRKLYVETHRTTLPTLLRCYDRYSMINGVEIRMPFMDYRIVNFAFSIPWSSKIRNGFTKAIVRDMAAPFMSKKILKNRFKIGFNSPLAEWFNGELKEFLIDMIYSKEFMECELVNALQCRIVVEEYYRQKKNDHYSAEEIWKMIIPYLWKKAVLGV